MKALPFYQHATPRVRLVTVDQGWVISEATRITGAKDAFLVLAPYFAARDREHLVVLHLDATHSPISAEVVAVGTLSSAPVHPREIFKGALLANAKAIIVAHNHPSGDVTPSIEDRRVYAKLREAGVLLDVPLLDFLVVAPGCFRSLGKG